MGFVRRGLANASLAALLASAILSSAQRSSQQQAFSSVDLTVLDSSANALANASVTLTDAAGDGFATGVTNQSGKFYASHFPPGAYKLTISLAGFQTYTDTVLVEEHSVTKLTSTLSIPDTVRRGQSTLSLAVKDANGAVIPQARVSVTQQDSGIRFEGSTDMTGTYRAAGLAAGKYRIVINARGFETVNSFVELFPLDTRTITFSSLIPKGATIYDPVPGTELVVEPILSHAVPELLPTPDIVALPVYSGPEGQPNRIRRFFSAIGKKLGL